MVMRMRMVRLVERLLLVVVVVVMRCRWCGWRQVRGVWTG